MEGGEEEPSTLGTVWYYAWEYGLEVVPVAAPTRGFVRAYNEGSTLGMGLSAVELGLDLSGIGPLARGGKFAVKGTVRGIGKVASAVKPLVSGAIDVAKTKAGQAYSFAKSNVGDAAKWMSETSDSVVGGLAGTANWMYSGAAGFFGRGKKIAPVKVADLPWKRAGARQAAKAIEAGQTSIKVASRDDAAEVVWRMFSSRGFTNTTGRTGSDVRNILGSKAGTYHWDDVLDAAGNVAGHGVDNVHGAMRHVQIHLYPDGDIIRIFYP